MYMDEFVKRLYDFKGIYIICWSQNSHYRYLSIFYRYFFRNSSTCTREIKFQNFTKILGIFDISAIFFIFLRFFGQPIIGWQFHFEAH